MSVIVVPQTYQVGGVTFSMDDVSVLQGLFDSQDTVVVAKIDTRNTPAIQKALLSGVALSEAVDQSVDTALLVLSPDGAELLGITLNPQTQPGAPVLSDQDMTILEQLFATMDMVQLPQAQIRNNPTLQRALLLEIVNSNQINQTASQVVLNLSQVGRALLGRT